MRCQQLKTLILKARPVYSVEPLLRSRIGSSLKALTLEWVEPHDIMHLNHLVPYVQALESFSVYRDRKKPPTKATPFYVLDQLKVLLAQLPRRNLRSLSIAGLDGSGLKHLSEFLKAEGKLPALEELCLPHMDIHSVHLDDVKDLGSTLRTSTAGTKLKKLLLGVSDTDSFQEGPQRAWMLISHILSLDVQDYRVLPQLETLLLANIDWMDMGNCLLHGAFPQLKEVRAVNDLNSTDLLSWMPGWVPEWYDGNNLEKTRLWCQLLQARPLSTFRENIHYCRRAGKKLPPLDVMKEVFTYLSRPLDARVTSNVLSLQLQEFALDNDISKALAGAIRSTNLEKIRSLSFFLGGKCDISNYKTLGTVLNHDYLPYLTTLSLGGAGKKSGSSAQKWEAFFAAVPEAGLRRVEKFLAGFPCSVGKRRLSIGCMFQALAKYPKVLSRTFTVEIQARMELEDLSGFSAAVRAGAFPWLHCLRFHGKLSVVLTWESNGRGFTYVSIYIIT